MIQEVNVSQKADVVLAQRYGNEKPGTLIPYEVMEAISGINRSSSHWPYFVKRFKARMSFGFKRDVKVVNNKGYEIVSTADQVTLQAEKRTRAVHRAAGRLIVSLRNVREDEMDDKTRSAHVMNLSRAGQLWGACRETLHTAHQIAVGNLNPDPKKLLANLS